MSSKPPSRIYRCSSSLPQTPFDLSTPKSSVKNKATPKTDQRNRQRLFDLIRTPKHLPAIREHHIRIMEILSKDSGHDFLVYIQHKGMEVMTEANLRKYLAERKSSPPTLSPNRLANKLSRPRPHRHPQRPPARQPQHPHRVRRHAHQGGTRRTSRTPQHEVVAGGRNVASEGLLQALAAQPVQESLHLDSALVQGFRDRGRG